MSNSSPSAPEMSDYLDHSIADEQLGIINTSHDDMLPRTLGDTTQMDEEDDEIESSLSGSLEQHQESDHDLLQSNDEIENENDSNISSDEMELMHSPDQEIAVKQQQHPLQTTSGRLSALSLTPTIHIHKTLPVMEDEDEQSLLDEKDEPLLPFSDDDEEPLPAEELEEQQSATLPLVASLSHTKAMMTMDTHPARQQYVRLRHVQPTGEESAWTLQREVKSERETLPVHCQGTQTEHVVSDLHKLPLWSSNWDQELEILCREYLKLKSDSIPSHSIIATLQSSILDGQWQEAEQRLQDLVKLQPEMNAFHYRLFLQQFNECIAASQFTRAMQILTRMITFEKYALPPPNDLASLSLQWIQKQQQEKITDLSNNEITLQRQQLASLLNHSESTIFTNPLPPIDRLRVLLQQAIAYQMSLSSSTPTSLYYDATNPIQGFHYLQSVQHSSSSVKALIWHMNQLLSASHDGSLCEWQMENGIQRSFHWQAHSDRIWSLDTNSALLLSASSDGTVKAWSNRRHCFTFHWLSSSPFCDVSNASFLDENSFIAGGFDGNIQWVDCNTQQAINSYSGHSKAISSLCVPSNERNLFFSGSKDGSVLLWDTRQDRFLSYGQRSFAAISSISCNALNQLLIGSMDSSLRELDLRMIRQNVLLRKWTAVHANTMHHFIRSKYLNSLSRCIVTGSEDGAFYYFDEAITHRIPLTEMMPVFDVAIQFRLGMLAACDQRGMIHFHKIE